jgi:hypothetical protein
MEGLMFDHSDFFNIEELRVLLQLESHYRDLTDEEIAADLRELRRMYGRLSSASTRTSYSQGHRLLEVILHG